MDELALLEKVAVLLGPWDGPADYEIVTGYLIGADCVAYMDGATCYLTQAKRVDHEGHTGLYTEDRNCAGIVLATDVEREPVAAIAEIIGKLRSLSAIDWLTQDVLTMRERYEFDILRHR
ncbi:hypothetical protein D3C87_1376230 [compost metagenome]